MQAKDQSQQPIDATSTPHALLTHLALGAFLSGSLALGSTLTAAEDSEAPAADNSKKESSAWDFGLFNRTRFGYDSNVPIEPDDVTTVSNTDSVALSNRLDLSVTYKLTDKDTFKLTSTNNWDFYTEASEYDLSRLGGVFSYQHTGGRWIPTAVVSFNHYQFDGDSALNDLNLYGGTAYVHNERHVTLAAAQIRWLDYHENEARSGSSVTARGSHWFVFGSAGRRLELDLRISSYSADADYESYFSIRPSVIGRWRWDHGIMDRRVDVSARVGGDMRTYDEARPTLIEDEDSETLAFGAEGDWWLTDHVIVGLYASYTQRTSNIERRDYDRSRTGAQLSLRW